MGGAESMNGTSLALSPAQADLIQPSTRMKRKECTPEKSIIHYGL